MVQPLQLIWKFLKLTRPLNLIFIAFTMWSMRYWVLLPLLSPQALEPVTQPWLFSILILSVVFIAAGGNVINDYFDVRADVINDPEHLIIGKSIDRRVPIYAHQIFTVLGLLLAAYYGWISGTFRFILIHFFAAASLWFYSTHFKKQFLVGNLLIALLTGIIPLTVGVFEVIPLIEKHAIELKNAHNQTGFSVYKYFQVLFIWFCGYSFFAFFTNFIREIQKDIADKKGDIELNRRTLPIVLGERTTKGIVSFLSFLFCVAIIGIEEVFLNNDFTKTYFFIFLILPTFLSNMFMFYPKNQKHMSYATRLMKAVMFFGVLYACFVDKLFISQ